MPRARGADEQLRSAAPARTSRTRPTSTALRAADRQDDASSRGTPKTVIPKIRHVLEYLRPGQHLLLGRRRRHEPRRRDAQPAAHGRGGASRPSRDGQGAGPPGPVRGRPGHGKQEAAVRRRRAVGHRPGRRMRARRRRHRWRTGRQHHRHHAGPPGPSRAAARTGAFPARPHRRVAAAGHDPHPGGARRPAGVEAGLPGEVGRDHGLGHRRREPWSWYFRETNSAIPTRTRCGARLRPDPPGQRRGVAGSRCAKAPRAERCCSRTAAPSACATPTSRRERRLEARFVVDASGQARSSATRSACAAGTRTSATWPSTATSRARSGCPSRTRPTSSSSPSSTGGSGTSRCTSGWTSVGAVVDPATGRRASPGVGAAAFLDRQIAAAPRTKAMLDSARRVQGPDRPPRLVLRVRPRRRRGLTSCAATPPASSTRCSRRASTSRCRRGSWRRRTWPRPSPTASWPPPRGPSTRALLLRAVLALPRAGAALLRQQPHRRVLLLGGAPGPSRRFPDAPRGLRARHGRPVRQGLRAGGARARRAACPTSSRPSAPWSRRRAIARSAPGSCWPRRAPAIWVPVLAAATVVERKAAPRRGSLRLGARAERLASAGGHRGQLPDPAPRRAVRRPAHRRRARHRAERRRSGSDAGPLRPSTR